MALKVLSIFDICPEAIKMPLVVPDLFKIRPDYAPDLRAPGQDLFDVTARSLLGLQEIVLRNVSIFFYRVVPDCGVPAARR